MEHRAGEVPVATTQILEVIFRLDFAGTDLSVGRGNMDLDAGERAKRAMALRQLPKPGGKRMGGGGGGQTLPTQKKKEKKKRNPPPRLGRGERPEMKAGGGLSGCGAQWYRGSGRGVRGGGRTAGRSLFPFPLSQPRGCRSPLPTDFTGTCSGRI